MTTIRKRDTVKSRNEIPLSGDRKIPVGTAFYCLSGGRNPEIAFYSEEEDAVFRLRDRDGQLTATMDPIPMSELPKPLREHLDLDVAPVTLKKGQFKKLAQPITLKNEKGEDITFPKGIRAKVLRGGSKPSILAMLPGENEFRQISFSSVGPELFSDGAPLEDDPRLNQITVRVKTIPEFTEETTARRGMITLGSHRIDVSCHGHGDPLLCTSLDKGAAKALYTLLESIIRDGGVEKRGNDDLVEDYLDFLAGDTYGMETFADFVRHKQESLRQLTEKYGRKK